MEQHNNLRRLAWLATIAAVALAVALPGSASADTSEAVIDFEDAPVGTQITTRYLHTGGLMQGVTFGEFGGGNAGELPRVEDAGEQAASGTKVASIYDDNGEFPDARTYGRFRFAKHFVRVAVGIAPGGSPRGIALTGYNAAGSPIVGAHVQKLVAAGAGYKVPLEIHDAAGQIAYFRVAPTGDGAVPVVKIDNLAFDVPTPGSPPPAPDFGLSLDQNSVMGEDVGVRRGESTTARIVVGRVNGASGPLAFSVNGLPPGVSARFLPQNPSGSPTVGLELTAADNAPAVNDREITVTADPQGNAQAGSAPRTMDFDLDVFRNYDLRVTGIEVTQGIQAQHTPCASNSQCAVVPSLPRLSPSNPAAAVPYQGVRLVRSKKTVARVFANTTQLDGVDGVGLVLRGFRDGKELPGSPLVRERKVAYGLFPHVTWTERTHPKGGEVFVLPPSWTSGSLTLQAELREPLRFIGHGAAECVEAGCAANNQFRMTGIPFISTGYIDLATVRMWFRGELASCAGEEPNESAARRCPAPWKALAKPLQLLPLQENGYNFDPVSYYGSVEITDLKKEYSGEDRSREAKYRLDDYADDSPRGCESRRFCADQLLGIYGPKYTTGGHSSGKLVTGIPGLYSIDQPYAVASWKSAQTHELSHGLGRAHADTECGGDSDGETGEDWPPDNRGIMDGVGYDMVKGWPVAQRSLGAFGSSDPDSPDFQKAQWYDYMSYCGKLPDGSKDPQAGKWTSVRGWEKNIDLLLRTADALGREGADAPRGAAAAAPVETVSASARATATAAGSAKASVLRVRAAVLGHASAQITGVKPRTGEPHGGPADARYAIVGRDAAGLVRSRTMAQVSHEHGHPGEHTESIVADIPALGVTRVELVGPGGTVLASRAASDGAPRVRVLSPRGGQRVGVGGNALVRWRASDPDGDRLDVKVDYSTDDGRSWRLIHLGRGGGAVRLPSGLMAASRRARIRVRANDGFHETAARSGRFRSVGHKPNVRITSPAGGTLVGADETVYLAGGAYDDQHLQLGGKRLQWFDGRRRLGRGSAISAAGLRPGRHVIRLVARDRLGRRSTASVRLRVRPVKPAVLSLAAPEAVGPAARRLRVRIATTVAAQAVVRGSGVRSAVARVSRRPRSVSVRVRPGSSALQLTLALRAGGRLTRVPLAIARG